MARETSAPSEDKTDRLVTQAVEAVDGTGDQFAMFAFLLAAGVIFHQALLGDWQVLSPHAAATIAAIWTLFRPRSVFRFVVLLAAVLVVWAVDMPAVVNHWMLMGLAILGAFVALAWGAANGHSRMFEPGALFTRLAPYFRILVLLVYVFAAFAKVNDSFLDPELSCGVAMYQQLLERLRLPLYAEWQQPFAIYGTIAVEAALPVLLAVPRMRMLGVVVGVGFHIMLGVAGHIPFSGFALAFYSLFLPDDVPARVYRLLSARERVATAVGRAVAIARQPWAFPSSVAAFLILAAAITYGPWPSFEANAERAVQLAFLAYAAVLVGIAGVLLWRGRFQYRPGFFRLAHGIWVLGPALVVLNGVSPYLGLKTQSTFTMYSNLQTEADRWNHRILPQEIQLFGLQDELVRVVDADDPVLAPYAGSDTELVLFRVQSLAQDRPDTRLVYATDAATRTVEQIGDDPTFGRMENVLLRKVLLFRDVPLQEENSCRTLRVVRGPEQGS